MDSQTLRATEAECAKVATAPRVSLADIEANIAAQYTFTGSGAIGPEAPGHASLDVLTICLLVLRNGFTIIGKSAPASPENFDYELGRKFAYEDAVSQVWPLMGYELRERLHRGVNDEALAEIAHEANRAWCEFNGDHSQPRWADAPAWQRGSAISGMAFHRANPDAGDSASHDSWMAEKVAAGWVHGENKNPDAVPPTHPCIVPFDELPPEQQFKDRLFRTIANAGFAAR